MAVACFFMPANKIAKSRPAIANLGCELARLSRTMHPAQRNSRHAMTEAVSQNLPNRRVFLGQSLQQIRPRLQTTKTNEHPSTIDAGLLGGSSNFCHGRLEKRAIILAWDAKSDDWVNTFAFLYAGKLSRGDMLE